LYLITAVLVSGSSTAPAVLHTFGHHVQFRLWAMAIIARIIAASCDPEASFLRCLSVQLASRNARSIFNERETLQRNASDE